MKIIYLGAVLALMAAPALAQQDHGERGGNPSQATGHPNANVGHAGGGGARGPQGTPRANAPAAQHGDRGGEHRGGAQQTAPAAAAPTVPAAQHNNGGNGRQDSSHRGDRGNNPAFNNNNNRPDNNRGNNNRFDNNRRANDSNRGGNRARDFNSYQRNFSSPRRYNAPRYRRPAGWYSHRWTYGERLPPAFFVRNYWIDDFFDYGLVSPPYGAVWVRYGSDALLIDEESGEVIQVVYGVFY